MKRRLLRTALPFFALILSGALVLALVMAERDSKDPLTVAVTNFGSWVQVRIENLSDSQVFFFYASDHPEEWSPIPPGMPSNVFLGAGEVKLNQYRGPVRSGRYYMKIGYVPHKTPIERAIQKVAGFFNLKAGSNEARYVRSNEFEVHHGPAAGFQEHPQPPDVFSGAFIHRAEVHELRDVLSGFGPINVPPSPVPPFTQTLHITFPGEADLPYLISCLSDPSAYVREQAASALSMFSVSAHEAIPELTRVAENDPEEIVRQRAREALYNIRGYDGGFLAPGGRIER